MKNRLLFNLSLMACLFVSGHASAQTFTAAPTPTTASDKVLNLFCDHYAANPNVTVSVTPVPCTNATLSMQQSGTDNYISATSKGGSKTAILFSPSFDATNYDKLHFDIYVTGTSSINPRITLADANGNGGSDNQTVSFGSAPVGQWKHYCISIAELIGLIPNSGNAQKPDATKLKSFWFFDKGSSSRSYYIDNIYLEQTSTSTGGGDNGDNNEKLGEDVAFESLTSLAPAPTGVDVNNIINVFSDEFESIEQVGVSVGKNSASVAVGRQLQSTSGDNLFFVDSQSGGTNTGIVFNQTIDATDFDVVCLDVYPITGGDNGLRPRVSLADATIGGTTPTEKIAKSLSKAPVNQWTHYEMKISDVMSELSSPIDKTKLKSIWFFDYGGGKRSYFVDNIYFKRTKTGGSAVTTESATVPVYDIEWASLCLPFDAQVPEGVSAYYAQSNDEGTVVLKMIGDVIPANTAVVINAEENTDGYVFEKTTETGEVIENNLFKGTTTVTRLVENKNYVLGGASENGTPVFKLYSRLDNGNNNMYLDPYKSYIPVADVPVVSGARTLNFVFDNVTAVDAIENVCSVNKCNYNISGQRVNENYKGLVIKNGKKVVVE